jgi:hypothetical protein
MQVTRLDPAAWTTALGQLDDTAEPYFRPDYHDLHHDDGEPVAWQVSDGDDRLLIVGLRVPIAGTDRWDLQSCNGYGGPLASSGADTPFLESAWEAWGREVAAAGCVAAFFRLHPLLDNRTWLPASATVRHDRSTVLIPLEGTWQTAWENADPGHRRKVRQARSRGLVVHWDESTDWEAFPDLYTTAMDRLQASARLRYGPDYFARLRQLPGVRLAAVRENRQLSAGIILLQGRTWHHYHLGARRPDADYRTMNLLFQDGFEAAVLAGKAGMHLGGGATTAAGDALLRFKRSLGGDLRQFQTSLVITDRDCYADLLRHWASTAGVEATWLLGYREPLPPDAPLSPKTETPR